MEQLIKVEHLKKSFGNVDVLKDINLDVEKADVVAVLGPSGSGKSTFLRSLIDLVEIDSGNIYIDGNALCENAVYPSAKKKRKILEKTGMVFQHFNLFPHKTVKENLMLAPLLKKQGTKAELEEKTLRILKKVGLTEKLNAMPNNLSGGQKQRVAIARALMCDPEILLFDEPTSALDPELTGEVLNVIRDLSKEKMTMLIVTHEIGFAKEAANKVMFMDEGYVLGFGTPEEIIDNSDNERIRNFFAKIKY
ncbi:MAG: amino acid ABC transporter ATP-binding protein [Firmicutes bacterium]|nr:amino acid ABC transporter ATP-binding protein [Bacillota bacterium]